MDFINILNENLNNNLIKDKMNTDDNDLTKDKLNNKEHDLIKNKIKDTNYLENKSSSINDEKNWGDFENNLNKIK